MHEVVFAPEAEEDLLYLYDYIADHSNPGQAYDYAERIRAYCLEFATFPQRGTCRDDLKPGLRIVSFERRITIAFHVTPTLVVIDRIFYSGRDVERLLKD